MQHTDSITPPSASIQRTFWRYTIPSITAMLVSGLYQIIDGIFVGHYVGFEGLASINMAWPIVFLLSGLGLMVGMGSGSLISISRGENKLRDGQQALSTGFVIIIALGLLSLVLLSTLAPVMLLAQGAIGMTFEYGLQYIDVFAWGSVITLAAVAIPMLVRNDESPTIATILLIIGALTNIVLDYLFIGVWGWALEGAAWATLISQTLVMVGGLVYFMSSRSHLQLSRNTFTFCPNKAMRILALGSSALVMYVYMSFVVALHNRLFMQYGSSLTVGAFAIVGYLMTLYYLLAEGVAEGMQPPVSYYYGANQAENIKKMFLLSLKVILFIGLVWVLLLNVFPETMISLFNSDNPALVDQTIKGIRLHLFAVCLDGFIVLSSVYFIAINQGGKAMAISVSNMLIQLPFLYILPRIWGVDGVWLAVPLSNIVLFLIVAPMVYYDIQTRSQKAKQNEPMASDQLARSQ